MNLLWIHRIGQRLLGRKPWLFLLARLNLKRLYTARYEPAFRHFVSLIPRKGMVIDIGANLGAMSVYLGQKNPDWCILSIEPIPDHVLIIKRLINRYGLSNIHVEQLAIGAENGFTDMMVPEEKGVLKHGLAHVQNEKDVDRKGDFYQVPVKRLDDLMNHLQLPQSVAAIKIDVENQEWEVLNGALQLIRQNKPIILAELWNDHKKTDCIHLMQSLGYETKVLMNEALVAYEGQDALDYFFIPPKDR